MVVILSMLTELTFSAVIFSVKKDSRLWQKNDAKERFYWPVNQDQSKKIFDQKRKSVKFFPLSNGKNPDYLRNHHKKLVRGVRYLLCHPVYLFFLSTQIPECFCRREKPLRVAGKRSIFIRSRESGKKWSVKWGRSLWFARRYQSLKMKCNCIKCWL